MHCKHRYRHGLTLVELLVAISVLGFVAVLGWRGLDSITRARASLNQELEQTRGMQLAFAQLQSDCGNAVDAAQLDGRAPIVIDSEHLTLARSVHADAEPTRLQLVTYRLRDGVLTRAESAVTRDLQQLDQYWQQAEVAAAAVTTAAATATATASSASAQPLPLQSGVDGLRLRVWANDGRGWRDAQSATGNALTSRGAMMNPEAGTTSTQTTWSGLEISLKLAGREASLSKIFLLGPA